MEYPDNPVFDPPSGDRAYYPTVIYDADGFGNGESGPFYRMWFSDGAGIGTATSDDGIDWIEGADCTGLTNAHHSNVLYDADGFGNGAAGPFYRIWYWDTANLYSVNAIRTATSDDGIAWADDQAVTQDGAKQIITGGAGNWNRGSYGPVFLIYQPGATNAGTDPFDYEYVMYYDGTTGAFEQVGLGYSSDGIHWVRYGDAPVFESGSEWQGAWGEATPWDSSYASYGSVIKDSDGLFHLFYSGGTTSVHEGIGYATSDDGIVWTKDVGNPYIERTSSAWNSQRAYTPTVTYDEERYSGHGDNTKFKLWFSGRDDGGNYTIGYCGTMIGTVSVSRGIVPSDPACLEEGGSYILPILQLIFDADAVEEITLESLAGHLSGTSLDVSAIESVLLYEDSNPDGAIGSDDRLIAEVSVEGDNIKFESIDEVIAASTSKFLLVAVRISAAADGNLTIRAGIANQEDIGGSGADSNQLIVSIAGTMDGEMFSLGACHDTPPGPDPGPGPEPGPDAQPDFFLSGGGGGCSCSVSDGETEPVGWIAASLLLLMLLVYRTSRQNP